MLDSTKKSGLFPANFGKGTWLKLGIKYAACCCFLGNLASIIRKKYFSSQISQIAATCLNLITNTINRNR